MTALRIPRRSLAGGEIDPELHHAADLVPVRNGLARVKNFIVRTKGGVERRPGTERLFTAKTTAAVRLMPFVRSISAAYLEVFGPSYLRIYPATATPGEAHLADLATPYGASKLWLLQKAQSNDVQWLVDGYTTVREVRRTSPTTFQFATAPLKNGPFMDEAPDQTTISASAETGSVTLTAADSGTWQADHVGSYILLREEDYSETPMWAPGKSVSSGDLVRFNGNVYRASGSGTTSSVPPEHLRGYQRDQPGGVNWQYLHSGYGIAQITALSSSANVTASVKKRLPSSVVSSGTTRWQEGSFSQKRGYPAAVALWKNALWFASTVGQPHFLWKSAIEGFDDFELGTEDDSALSRGLYGGGAEAIYWLAPGVRMLAGTNGNEWVARPTENGDTIRPRNLITQEATAEGASQVPGLSAAGRTLFIDGGLKRLVASGYDYRIDAYVSQDVSILAPHLLAPGIVELHYQRRPWPLFWALRADGRVAAVTFLPEQEVTAWHWHDFGDPVESLAVLPDEWGDERLWLAIRRGGSVSIERMFAPWRPAQGHALEDARFLDAAVVWDDGALRQTFSGLDHLEGRWVVALVDGLHHPPVQVVAGAVTLIFPGRNVAIGLPYDSEWRTLPPDNGAPDNYQAGRNHRASELVIGMVDSLGGDVLAADGTRERIFPLGDADLDTAPKPYTGARRVSPIADDEGCVTYRNDTAWPATITAIYTEDLT